MYDSFMYEQQIEEVAGAADYEAYVEYIMEATDEE